MDSPGAGRSRIRLFAGVYEKNFPLPGNQIRGWGVCIIRKEAGQLLDPYIRQYGRRIYGLCRSLCSSVQDAEDLYQDTWLKALDKLDQYDPARPFAPWIVRICVNTYRSALRRLARSPLQPFPEGLEVPAPEREGYGPLYEAVRRLPEKLRLAVVLYYFQDLDAAEAAKVLGVPLGTVKSRLSRARKLLKEALSDESGSTL